MYTIGIGPIQDCDETFNYWEPLHYLTHGYGLQTWEYSPEFSIRSWTYILLHALPIKAMQAVGINKKSQFEYLRILFAMIFAAIQTRLYAVISRTLHTKVGEVYLLISIAATGFHHSSSAFLPSTFAMYTGALGLASFMDMRRGPKTASAIMWFGIGALLGWPFAGALILPFVAYDLLISFAMGDVLHLISPYLDGIVRCLTILGIQVGIDAFFYRKLVVVPWRIVLYNVFGGQDKGPDIFGTEPWHFYIRNLILNFNIWFPLALAAGPLVFIEARLRAVSGLKQPLTRTLALTSPFCLWFAIFTLQPHKEERFMFPAYPFLALNAAISAYIIGSAAVSLVQSAPKSPRGAPIYLSLIGFAIFTTSLLLGVSRTIGFQRSYSAPMKIYDALQDPKIASPGATVCIGKDWYRFPSSFYLPYDMHAKFVKSNFDGLLPGEFSENRELGFFPGTWLTPSGMNDRNEEDFGKYTDVRQCSFLVDSRFSSVKATETEPDYAADTKSWKKIQCEPFLDSAATPFLARIIWLPEYSFVPQRLRRVWGEHCLLKAQ